MGRLNPIKAYTGLDDLLTKTLEANLEVLEVQPGRCAPTLCVTTLDLAAR